MRRSILLALLAMINAGAGVSTANMLARAGALRCVEEVLSLDPDDAPLCPSPATLRAAKYLCEALRYQNAIFETLSHAYTRWCLGLQLLATENCPIIVVGAGIVGASVA